MKSLRILMLAACMFPLLATAGEQPLVEDFSKMRNGRQGTYGDFKGNLAEKGSDVNGWESRGFSQWILEDSTALKKKILTTFNSPISWKAVGRKHKFDLFQAREVQLSMQLVEQLDPTEGWIWLSDSTQNGYGAIYTSRKQTVTIFKIHDGKIDFTPRKETPDWVRDDTVSVKLPEKVEEGAVVTLFVQIKQASDTSPITLKAWAEGPKNKKYGSEKSPLVEWKDHGDGAGMTVGFGDAAQPAKATPPYTFKELSYLAFGATGTKECSANVVNLSMSVK